MLLLFTRKRPRGGLHECPIARLARRGRRRRAPLQALGELSATRVGLTALVRGDLAVIGEDDGPGGEFGLIYLLEPPYRGGGAVCVVRLLVSELKKVNELRRV